MNPSSRQAIRIATKACATQRAKVVTLILFSFWKASLSFCCLRSRRRIETSFSRGRNVLAGSGSFGSGGSLQITRAVHN